MNPYWGTDFFTFLGVFLRRMYQCCIGQLSFQDLASDEIQIFVLLGVALSSAIVGAFLVLKRMTMLANALSHTILLGIGGSYLIVKACSDAFLFSLSPLVLILAALLTACMTFGLTDICRRFFGLQEDASIGLVFTWLFALGIALITLYMRNVHLDVEAIMGNMDALHQHDIILAFSIFGMNALCIVLMFNNYKLVAFDEVFAKTIGNVPMLFQYILMLQTALTAIGAFRAVGVFLFLIFITAPVLAAKQVTKSLVSLIFSAMGISSLCSIVAVALSRHILSTYDIAVSTAGLACVCTTCSYPIAIGYVKTKAQVMKLYHHMKTKCSYEVSS